MSEPHAEESGTTTVKMTSRLGLAVTIHSVVAGTITGALDSQTSPAPAPYLSVAYVGSDLVRTPISLSILHIKM